MHTPGPRHFTPRDPIWRVHVDSSMYCGGLAALLMQLLHPMAMAGVAGHSGYQGDPWGRLQRTGHYIATTTFATIPQAEAAIAQVRTIHERVRGKDAFGRPYRASDPHLLMWVHCAEISSFLTAFQAFGAGRLTMVEADRYVAQTGWAASLLGVDAPPRSVAELESVMNGYRAELEVTEAARTAARFILFNPPVKAMERPAYTSLAAGAIACLPPWAREQLNLRGPAWLLQPLGRLAGRASISTMRWATNGQIARTDERVIVLPE